MLLSYIYYYCDEQIGQEQKSFNLGDKLLSYEGFLFWLVRYLWKPTFVWILLGLLSLLFLKLYSDFFFPTKLYSDLRDEGSQLLLPRKHHACIWKHPILSFYVLIQTYIIGFRVYFWFWTGLGIFWFGSVPINVLKPRLARPVKPENSGTGGKAGPEGSQLGRGSKQHIPGSTRLVKPETVTRNRDPFEFCSETKHRCFPFIQPICSSSYSPTRCETSYIHYFLLKPTSPIKTPSKQCLLLLSVFLCPSFRLVFFISVLSAFLCSSNCCLFCLAKK